MAEIARLPAEDRLEEGLLDLRQGRPSVNALWLSAAETRLRSLGIAVPVTDWLPEDREIALYDLLQGESDDPYYRYNSLRGELDSLLCALESRKQRLETHSVSPTAGL